ncbi:hypothetical protein I5535_19695 [Rhodobacteraceae bacterium F11138]|nr:hypothetical protein [Rhodobacteraceae bacterium F11138]
MKLRGLSELEQGRWEYRRRVPEAAKAALGKGEWKRVPREAFFWHAREQ